MDTIDIAPSWESAVKIYIAVLENDNAQQRKKIAREDIIFLAKTIDQLNKVKRQKKSKMDNLTEQELKAVFDVVNVFEPEDISHVYPEMATDEFMMNVLSAWKKIF